MRKLTVETIKPYITDTEGNPIEENPIEEKAEPDEMMALKEQGFTLDQVLRAIGEMGDNNKEELIRKAKETFKKSEKVL